MFCGWYFEKDFCNFIFKIHLYLPMECILTKEKFEDENFTDSEVTVEFAKFTSRKNYLVYDIQT